MKCKDIENLLELQPLKETTAEQLSLMQNHADSCPACRALLATESRLEDSLHALEEPDVPETLAANVMARIENTESSVPHYSESLIASGTGNWSIAMLVVGFTITLGLYTYQLFQGQSTLFNIFSLWNGEWSQWVITPLQFNQVGLGLACGFVFYAMGFLFMFEQKEPNY